jgi:chitin disaccharide deacetylase
MCRILFAACQLRGQVTETSQPTVIPGHSPSREGAAAAAQAEQAGSKRGDGRPVGLLIINGDDWGRNTETTDRMFECVAHGTVSSVSAMVFMEDSERAAAIARDRAVDAGLHLNLTTPFSASNCPSRLSDRQREISSYLLRRTFHRMIFHPGLARSFEYVVKAQLEEFCRLYGTLPGRIDGHHHMHLCANVLLGRLLPAGTLVRRNFSFRAGEKSLVNRLYRGALDRGLARRHRLVDFFFSLPPLDPPSRLERIFSLANQFTVEVETHPVHPEEYRFLMGEKFLQLTANVPTPRVPARRDFGR